MVESLRKVYKEQEIIQWLVVSMVVTNLFPYKERNPAWNKCDKFVLDVKKKHFYRSILCYIINWGSSRMHMYPSILLQRNFLPNHAWQQNQGYV